MSTEDLLRRLRRDADPKAGAVERVKARLHARIAAPAALRALRTSLTPRSEAKTAIWNRITSSLGNVRAENLLRRCREWISSFQEDPALLWQRFQPRLAPVRQRSMFLKTMNWVAAFLLVAFIVELSPRLFWAPKTAAESETTLLPISGEVYVSISDLWQPVNEDIAVKAGMQVKTGEEGEASIVFGDAGVLRLSGNTEIKLIDVSDRLEPATELVPTVSLLSGKAWMQGLVPSRLRGLTISTSAGLVTVNEGSVSVEGDKDIAVAVYDRHATVTHDGRDSVLVSAERTQLWDGNIMLVKKVPDSWFDTPWVRDNLSRDAVHRQEIAALQQARLAGRAGILPTSKLYSMKRAAEAVDMFLTIGEEAKLQKRLQYADNRLTEAAALLSKGETGAVTLPLEEYRSTFLALATGSGDSTLAHFLLQQAMMETTGEVSAALPGDQGYILKKVVLEASSALPGDASQAEDLKSTMLLDALTVLTQAVDSGNVQGVEEMWKDLEPQMEVLHSTGATLTPEVRKEATAALSALATAMEKQELLGQTENLDPTVREDIAAYLPPEEQTTPTLSESDVQSIVQGIKSRIFAYHLEQSRMNQFLLELRSIENHPDQGRILRRLYFALPDGPESFPEKVRQEIIRLSWKHS